MARGTVEHLFGALLAVAALSGCSVGEARPDYVIRISLDDTVQGSSPRPGFASIQLDGEREDR